MPGSEREGVSCTFNKGNTLIPTIINNTKTIRVEKKEGRYLVL